MRRGTLIWRSLQFRARAHLGVALGALVGSAALVGALVVGDSVRASLRHKALERVGAVDFLLAPADRFFSSGSNTWGRAFGDGWAVGLQLAGVASAQGGAARANGVQAYGVNDDFFKFAPAPARVSLPPGAVLLNEALAAQLQARPGDEVLLRVRKPSALSRETPLAPVSDLSTALRLKVQAIARAGQFGNFSRTAGPAPPLNAFVRLEELQRAAGVEGRANLVLLGGRERGQGAAAAEEPERLAAAFGQSWGLADAELALTNLGPGRGIELRSSRIFLEPAAVRAATEAARQGRDLPGSGYAHSQITNVHNILTYLVNQIRAGTNSTPYSMVTAAGPPWTPADLGADEIVLNQWLADDLRAGPGALLEVSYFLPESGVQLVEATNRFRVRGVAPLAGPYADRTLMPEFPGLAKAESTHDWDAGFPLVHTIRPKDEAYWKQYRGTPKAFVAPRTGAKLWANRFGSLTAVRFPVPAGTDAAACRDALERAILQALKPADLGLRFEPVRAQALAAANQAQDFGQLFLGFSFFLIVAALLLVWLLFQFGLEQRASEVGLLLAVGFTPKQVRRLFWMEGSVLALLGGLGGTLGGLAYARALLTGLTTIWREAVSTSALQFHVTVGTLLTGLAASVVVGSVTIWLVLRRLARRPARELLAEDGERGASSGERGASSGERGAFQHKRTGRGFWIGVVALGGALALVGWALGTGRVQAAGVFFGAGSLLLVAGLGFMAAWLAVVAGSQAAGRLSVTGLGVRGATRRRQRSLAVAGLLACGSFLIVAIGAFKLDAQQNAWRREAGTGGFALVGQSTLPVVRDLNTPEGRAFYALDENALTGVSVAPMRVHEGDEASCLNLNRARQPRLLGVNPELLARRGAFTFAGAAAGWARREGWRMLERTNASGEEVPAIGDQNSIVWALGKRLGDTVDFVDEHGRAFKVRLVGALANSILQGNLLIDEAAFTARFPSASGYRFFLVDAPSNAVAQVSATLTRALQDAGLELTPTARRLAAFNAVQNTYLNTFQVLGGIGLLLGSAGLGVVVLRNVLERRGELALLQAVGFRRRTLQWLVLSEHAALLWLGLAIGLLAALVAVLPALRTPGSGLPVTRLALTAGAVLASGLAWTWLATWAALRGRLLEALRNE